MNKLTTPVSHELIFSLDLSYHTKCILLKIVTDFVCDNEEMDLFYLQENILSVWPTKVVMNALDELADEEIMFLDFCNCDEEDEDYCDGECEGDEAQILFNPEFLKDACPYIGVCSCCNDIPKKFNVIYN